MSSVFVPVPPFPNVPKLPGVPQLARQPVAALAAEVPGIIRTLQVQAMPGVLVQSVKAAPVWGVFDSSGAQVIAPDSIMSFNQRSEWRVSDYPVQNGAFASYDKVIVPTEILFRMVKGGSLQDRQTFMADCEFVAAALTLYTIITPEQTYQNMNPIRFEVNRVEVKGAFFIEAEMYFRQINQTDAQYSSTTTAAANTANAQNPAAVPPSSLGIVQPISVPTAVQSAIESVIGPSPFPGLVP